MIVSQGVFLIILGFCLFISGALQIITSKKFLGFLFGIEMIINASNIVLLGFLQIQPARTDLEPLMAMVIAYAVIETVVGLSIFTYAASHGLQHPEVSVI